ncbi:hypothetical protein [Humibacillus sp. DSM 29435]|uniref:hypothetical protein n=1 Tax=Humibacillus sp. DSM 29435 TaxID=1869167 RepID=UPI001586457C|nr:hypothetical protein [Humibacillus sp. DSM 29435]
MNRHLLASSRAGRVAAASLSGLAVAGLTAGCMVFSPVQTTVAYDPADGNATNIGAVALRDLSLVGGAGQAVISGSAINEGDARVTVQVAQQASDGSVAGGSEVELAPREQVDLSTRNLVLSNVAAKPGAVATLRVTATPGGTTIITVPVLAANRYLSTVTPTAVPTTPAPATPTVTAPAPAAPTTPAG